MFKKVAGTFGTKLTIALCNLLILTLNSRFLGAEGLGTIALIILAISFTLLLNEFAGGGALVYLSSRIELKKLISSTYLWNILIAACSGFILLLIPIVPYPYILAVVSLSLIQGFSTINNHILLGNGEIKAHNISSLIQALTTLLGLILLLLFYKHSVESYLLALFISSITSFIYSGIILLKKYTFWTLNEQKDKHWKVLFRFGSINQLANISQLLNQRIVYYFIDSFLGRATLGMFSAATQIAESVWVIGRSIATVQYSEISKLNDARKASTISLSLIKVSLSLSALATGFLLLLPNEFFNWLLGNKFELEGIIATLSLGIIAMSGSFTLSHHFAGLGKPEYNALASFLGLLIILLSGYFLITEQLQIYGAGLANSISYVAIFLFQSFLFIRENKLSLLDLLPNSKDIEKLIQLTNKNRR